MQVLVTIPDEIAAQVLASGASPESYVQELIAARNPAAPPGIAKKLLDLESFLPRSLRFLENILCRRTRHSPVKASTLHHLQSIKWATNS
jgi:hypothetical protein